MSRVPQHACTSKEQIGTCPEHSIGFAGTDDPRHSSCSRESPAALSSHRYYLGYGTLRAVPTAALSEDQLRAMRTTCELALQTVL